MVIPHVVERAELCLRYIHAMGNIRHILPITLDTAAEILKAVDVVYILSFDIDVALLVFQLFTLHMLDCFVSASAFTRTDYLPTCAPAGEMDG